MYIYTESFLPTTNYPGRAVGLLCVCMSWQ